MGSKSKHSPLPSLTLNFSEAINEVIKGCKITRKEWSNGVYCFLNKEWLSIHKEDGKNYKWLVNDGDLLANDWIVVL